MQDCGLYDKDQLIWVRANLENYEGTDEIEDILKALKALLALGDEELKQLNDATRKKGKGRSIKKDALPFLNSNISYLPLFDTELHKMLVEIRSHNNIMNGEIDQSEYFYKMTFDMNLDNNNRAIINQSLDKSYRFIADDSRRQVNRINMLVTHK
jgi:hypothetical protein